MQLDMTNRVSQAVQTLEFRGDCSILVSSLDSSKFLLQRDGNICKCELINSYIQIGKNVALDWNLGTGCVSYWDKQTYKLEYQNTMFDILCLKITDVKYSKCLQPLNLFLGKNDNL